MSLAKINPEDERYIHRLIDYLNKSGLTVEINHNNYTNLLVMGYENIIDSLINNLKLCSYGELNLPFLPEGNDHVDLLEIIVEDPNGHDEYFTQAIRLKIGRTFIGLTFSDWD
ncbi:hypothetical protein HYX16_03780 [Candidatus Woesearchaeota archaeon]|nr:hypothetical protein [Candidatus Woesearchaeota archaeon]